MVNNAELSKVLSTVEEDSLEYRNVFESNLIYLGTFGLDDPLRDGIKEQINEMQYGNPDGKPEDDPQMKPFVTVQMVSGDHLETAKSIAL